MDEAAGKVGSALQGKAEELIKTNEEQTEQLYSISEMLRNVGVLSFCFGIGWATLFIQVNATTVAAKQWGSTAFSIIPYGILATTHAIVALPAQLLMRRLGERLSYMFGGLMGCIGNALCIIAALKESPLLLCLGAIFCGIANAYVNFLRFEPVRFVTKKHVPLAISAVITGGVIGGGAGPVISRFSINVLPHEFEATYLFATCLWALYVLLIPSIQFHKVHAQPVVAVSTEESAFNGGEEGLESLPKAPLTARPMREIFFQPDYLVALISGATSYAVMAVIMLNAITALKAVNPVTNNVELDVQNGKYSFADVSNTILIHVEAMFFPSFFTGVVMATIGPVVSINVGLFFLLGSIFLFLIGTQLWLFFVSLGFLGLGWNLSYVGATTLLTTTYNKLEKDKAQGINDGVIFGLNSIITTTSGVVLQYMNNWDTFVIVYGCIGLPSFLVALIFLLKRYLG